MATFPPAPTRRHDYRTDGDMIYQRSFAMIREEAKLDGMAADLADVAVRMIHAAGDVDLAGDIVGHPQVVAAARASLGAGGPIFVDSAMLAAGITRRRLPADNEIICTLADPQTGELAKHWHTTRSAAALEFWRPKLAGAVCVIGNAPTALFHLLEMMADGGPLPGAIIGVPVGFVGAAESKLALMNHAEQAPWLTVRGRRGGSAIAVAAVNALASTSERA